MTLTELQQHIHELELQHHRELGSVKLLLASKQQSVEKIHALYLEGQRVFGENYLQEALPKINALRTQNIEWHFIGHIQRNKTRQIAQCFSWVHSIDRCDIAERLNAARALNFPPLQVCIEVNFSGDENKSGVSFDQLPALIHCIQALPRLHWRGLMTMITDDYAALAKTFHRLQQEGYAIDTLSMGMSQDYAKAIACGATLIRIGTALFGERKRL